ncbi:hypothetical protein [Ornithinibacillus caprae]|uniref:hypothetical protein n=1 Tax=Ornithinibacillus caprae TaxID=2678566 RepID=UPI001FE5C693|nr:hypothetical protein [Ornithinibacillus caprae]
MDEKYLDSKMKQLRDSYDNIPPRTDRAAIMKKINKSSIKKGHGKLWAYVGSFAGLIIFSLLILSSIEPLDHNEEKTGIHKEQTLEDYFYKKMEEMHADEDWISYSLMHTERNVVKENDGITIFTEGSNEGEKIFIAYFEKLNGKWEWKQTRGASWDSPLKWSAMNQEPYIYSGTINDNGENDIASVFAGEAAAKIIDIKVNKRFWYAISEEENVEVKFVMEDGTEEIMDTDDRTGDPKKNVKHQGSLEYVSMQDWIEDTIKMLTNVNESLNFYSSQSYEEHMAYIISDNSIYFKGQAKDKFVKDTLDEIHDISLKIIESSDEQQNGQLTTDLIERLDQLLLPSPYNEIKRIIDGYELPKDHIVEETNSRILYENGYEFSKQQKGVISRAYSPERGPEEPTEEQYIGVILGFVNDVNTYNYIDIEKMATSEAVGSINGILQRLYDIKKYAEEYQPIKEWAEETISYLEEAKEELEGGWNSAAPFGKAVINISNFADLIETGHISE